MEIGKRIKSLRTALSYSQDELAEKIYVSRQTISNWENDKNYPDINSLLLISNLFNVTLDNLVKGDIEEMKQQVKTGDIKYFCHEANIFSVLLLCTIILPIPLAKFLGYIGIGIWSLIACLGIYYAIKVEKLKKSYNIQTYKEILTFIEGDQLDNNQRNQEQGKRPYQKVLLATGALISSIVISIIITYLIK